MRCVGYDAEFNFSATVNLGAAHATGTHLLFLNDDTEAVSDGWLATMVAALDHGPHVGAVGAKLLFEDGTCSTRATRTARRSTTSASASPPTRPAGSASSPGAARWSA